MSSNSSDSGLIRLKESLPSDVAGKMITKNKNTETLKFRMEIINPNGSKTIDSLRQVELTIVPVDKEISESNLSKKLKK
jgi:hypothetical protein